MKMVYTQHTKGQQNLFFFIASFETIHISISIDHKTVDLIKRALQCIEMLIK